MQWLCPTLKTSATGTWRYRFLPFGMLHFPPRTWEIWQVEDRFKE